MPNWCANKLTVTESTPKLEAFLKEHGLSFEAIVKPERPENDENGFGTIGAQTSAWGTKWDLTEEEAQQCASSLLNGGECYFDTAWSPPSEAIRALSELTGAHFLLAHYEPGCYFWGAESIGDGCIADELSCDETKKQLHEFLMQYMGYDKEDADDAVFWDEAEEE